MAVSVGNSALREVAAKQQLVFDALTLSKDRKTRGHFGTPPAVAKFMAEMFSAIPQGVVRILDAGAGVGTLSAAICQRVLEHEDSCQIEFELWENDPKLLPYLRKTMDSCQNVLRKSGHILEYAVRHEDFILANMRTTLFEGGPAPSFHLAILNPPYYKLRKDSVHARAMTHIVHGQPNIYAFFMAVAAEKLLSGGELVAITPRSYFNGPYFKRFRKWFFERMVARHIHVFESRTETFQEDKVLQENVILRAQKSRSPEDVVLTSCRGREFEGVQRCVTPYSKVFDGTSGNHVIRVTTDPLDREIVNILDGLPHQLRVLGYEISTGPVVTFRSTTFLRDELAEDTAPLLWMHNIRPFSTRFPPKNGKPAHIAVSEKSMRLLIPAKRYVLLKRFSAKEEKRRLVAGVFEPTDSYSPWLGLENHLNYVYRKGSQLSRAEAIGIAAFFNSVLVDRYFRAISGNTQVNATEIRAMPMPDKQTILEIGSKLEEVEDRDYRAVELIVSRALQLPSHLLDELLELAE